MVILFGFKPKRPKNLLGFSTFLHEGKYEPFTEQEHSVFVQKKTALERYFQLPKTSISLSKRELFELIKGFIDQDKRFLFLDYLQEERLNPKHDKIKYYCMVKFLLYVPNPTEEERQAIWYMLDGLRNPRMIESSDFDVFVCSITIPDDLYLLAQMGLIAKIVRLPKATVQQLSLNEQFYYVLPHQENGMPRELFYSPKGHTLKKVLSLFLQDSFYYPLPSNLPIT